MTRDEIRRRIEIIFYREGTEDFQIEVKKELLAEYDRLTALKAQLVDVLQHIYDWEKGEWVASDFEEKAKAAIRAAEESQ